MTRHWPNGRHLGLSRVNRSGSLRNTKRWSTLLLERCQTQKLFPNCLGRGEIHRNTYNSLTWWPARGARFRSSLGLRYGYPGRSKCNVRVTFRTPSVIKVCYCAGTFSVLILLSSLRRNVIILTLSPIPRSLISLAGRTPAHNGR